MKTNTSPPVAIVLLLIVLCSHTALASENCGLSIVVQGLKNSEGQIVAGLHREAGGFPDKPYLELTEKIAGKQSTVSIENVLAGEYAIALFHDENLNGKLDHGFLGIAHKEGFGVSNNRLRLLAPPRYKDARIHFDGECMTIEIKLKYP